MHTTQMTRTAAHVMLSEEIERSFTLEIPRTVMPYNAGHRVLETLLRDRENRAALRMLLDFADS